MRVIDAGMQTALADRCDASEALHSKEAVEVHREIVRAENHCPGQFNWLSILLMLISSFRSIPKNSKERLCEVVKERGTA